MLLFKHLIQAYCIEFRRHQIYFQIRLILNHIHNWWISKLFSKHFFEIIYVCVYIHVYTYRYMHYIISKECFKKQLWNSLIWNKILQNVITVSRCHQPVLTHWSPSIHIHTFAFLPLQILGYSFPVKLIRNWLHAPV